MDGNIVFLRYGLPGVVISLNAVGILAGRIKPERVVAGEIAAIVKGVAVWGQKKKLRLTIVDKVN